MSTFGFFCMAVADHSLFLQSASYHLKFLRSDKVKGGGRYPAETLPLCVNTGHRQMVENWRLCLNHTEHMHMGEFAKTQGMGCEPRTGTC